MSAKRKQSAVLRLLQGEDLELVSRELSVPAAELSAWRDAFLAAGEASLKTRPADGSDAEIGRLKAKVGDVVDHRYGPHFLQATPRSRASASRANSETPRSGTAFAAIWVPQVRHKEDTPQPAGAISLRLGF